MTKIFISLLFLAVGVYADVNFISVGDWGGASLGGYQLKNAQNVAVSMYNISNTSLSKFVINTGDNFYYCGIQDIHDPQITEDYVSLFGHINLPWYNSLGNHDYGFKPEAQINLSSVIKNWIMDDRYYWHKLVYDEATINLIALDTNPCVNDYRGNDRAKWDPCNFEFPTCGPIPGECFFHQNIISQECKPQLLWLKDVLSKIPNDEWIIIFGHHPAQEINTEDFQTLLDSPNVHLYLNGHVHSLQHYSINGNAKYITTGAGSMVVPHDDLHLKVPNKNKNIQEIWGEPITGYTTHTIIGNKLITDYRDINNNILHTFTISK
jgi:tartrate-resistant acid phosphatase type 5